MLHGFLAKKEETDLEPKKSLPAGMLPTILQPRAFYAFSELDTNFFRKWHQTGPLEANHGGAAAATQDGIPNNGLNGKCGKGLRPAPTRESGKTDKGKAGSVAENVGRGVA
jgi:hypothetical protein